VSRYQHDCRSHTTARFDVVSLVVHVVAADSAVANVCELLLISQYSCAYTSRHTVHVHGADLASVILTYLGSVIKLIYLWI